MKRLLPASLLALVVVLAGAGLAAVYGQAKGVFRLDDEPALAVAAILIAAITAVLLASIAWLVQAPARVAHSRGDARRRARQEALSRGFMALGAGDPAEARRWAEAAERTDAGGPAHPLSRLLAAWAAEAEGDLAAAVGAYESLVDHPEARLAALRGLMLVARRRRDEAGALARAQAAYALATPPGWAWRALFDARLASGDRAGALALVEEGLKRRVFPAATAARLQAVVHGAGEPAEVDAALREPAGG